MKPQVRSALLQVAAAFLFLSCNPLASWSQTPESAGRVSANAPATANWKTTERGKHLTIRVNPDANMSRYRAITVGSVAYTGPVKKLKPRESEELVSLLHDSLAKDLSATQLSPDSSATETLTLNANITKVKRSHPLVNVVTMAAVFVPLDLGDANVTARIVDEKTGQVIAEIETVGCGQIYQVLGSLHALGQSKILLKKESRTIAKEVARMNWNQQQPNVNAGTISSGE